QAPHPIAAEPQEMVPDIALGAGRTSAAGRQRFENLERPPRGRTIRGMTDHEQAFSGAELVLGLVGPVGVDFNKFIGHLKTAFDKFGYGMNEIRLSHLASSLQQTKATARLRKSAGPGLEQEESEFRRIKRLMDAGDALRAHRREILALAATHRIHQARKVGPGRQVEPLAKTAHVLRSLKHPEEVLALRRIYGPGFFLVGVVATPE